MKRIFYLFSVTLMILVSCQTKYLTTKQKINTIKKLDCLLGKWVTYSTVYSVVETWKKVNDTTLEGSSIMIMSGDTVLNEKMSIQPGRKYINLYSKNISVTESDFENYRLTKLTPEKITFQKVTTGKSENITYNFITSETMRISIETDGKSVESYNMKKIIKK
jgi:hypothetical protein